MLDQSLQLITQIILSNEGIQEEAKELLNKHQLTDILKSFIGNPEAISILYNYTLKYQSDTVFYNNTPINQSVGWAAILYYFKQFEQNLEIKNISLQYLKNQYAIEFDGIAVISV